MAKKPKPVSLKERWETDEKVGGMFKVIKKKKPPKKPTKKK